MKNKIYIPSLSTIFFLLTIATTLLSWIGSIYGKQGIQSLLSPDAIRWELRNIIPNYVNVPALGIVLILFIGCGIFIYSGLSKTLKQLVFNKTSVTRKEKRALLLTAICFCCYLIAIFISTFSPIAILRGITGSLENSAFMAGIFYIISFGIGICGITYGYASGFFRNDKEIIYGMTFLLKNHSSYFVSLFFIVQFFTSLIYSGIPGYLGVENSTIFFIFYFTTYAPLIQLFTEKSK